MKRKYISIVIISIISFFNGCGSQRYDGIGKGYQLNECQSIPDNFERNNCLSKVNSSYEKHKQEKKYGDN